MATGIQSSSAVPGSASADLASKAEAAKAQQQVVQPGSPQALANAGILPLSGSAAPTPESQAQLDTLQKIPQNPTLSAMEKNHMEMSRAKEVGAKLYHGIPGSSFFMKDGTRYEFNYKGEMEITNSEVQKELDLIADKPGSTITQKNLRPTPAPGDDQPVKEIQDRAAATMAELSKQGVR